LVAGEYLWQKKLEESVYEITEHVTPLVKEQTDRSVLRYNHTCGGCMRTRDFEEFARNQLIINLSLLCVILTTVVSVVVVLASPL
jgi:hypothetical protein